jgi:hypothetical protein
VVAPVPSRAPPAYRHVGLCEISHFSCHFFVAAALPKVVQWAAVRHRKARLLTRYLVRVQMAAGVNWKINGKAHSPQKWLENGVQSGDGDGTVPLVSLGAMCAGPWRERELNPHGVKARSLFLIRQLRNSSRYSSGLHKELLMNVLQSRTEMRTYVAGNHTRAKG